MHDEEIKSVSIINFMYLYQVGVWIEIGLCPHLHRPYMNRSIQRSFILGETERHEDGGDRGNDRHDHARDENHDSDAKASVRCQGANRWRAFMREGQINIMLRNIYFVSF